MLFITGCATKERAWNKAKEENSIWSYEEFLLKYPEGDYTEKAKLVYEEVFWQSVSKTRTGEEYLGIFPTVEEYLDLFLEGKYVDEAREVLDEAAWWLAVRENTYAGYRDYLDQYPQGSYAGEASKAVMFLSASQYMAIIIPGRMYRPAYKKLGLLPQVLSRTSEDSGTVTSPLVPWGICGVFFYGCLGVPTLEYLPRRLGKS